MGAVYKARDERTGSLVALKVVKDQADPAFFERFERETKAAASIHHPGVTAVLDSGVVDRAPFIAFELVTGGTLRARLRTEGRLGVAEVVRVARGLTAALAEIHAAGLVHRDVKPENVLLAPRGETGECDPKLSDLGLVRRAGPGTDLTRTGELVGTVAYLSPEQANGERVLDGRADLYSLGVLMFELLTGEVPFKGQGYSVLIAHMKEAPPSPRALVPEIPPALERLVLHLLEKAPAARPGTAAEVARALDALDVDRGLPSGVKVLLGAAVAAMLLAGAAIAFAPGRRAPVPAPALRPSPPIVAPVAPPPPPAPIVFPETAPECLEKADGLLAKDPGTALRFADQAIAVDTSLTAAYWTRGKARRALGRDVEPTAEEQARAAKIVQESGEIYSKVGFAKDQEAIRAVLGATHELLAIEWKNAPIWTVRGDLLRMLDDLPEAARCHARAIELDPGLAIAHLRLADVWLQDPQRPFDPSIEELRLTLALPIPEEMQVTALRKRSDAYTRKSDALATAGDRAAARRALDAAIADIGDAFVKTHEPRDRVFLEALREKLKGFVRR
jgi:serine/threonine-protein kinase